jgi:phospholipid transport system transporter-binding protein
VNAGAANGDAVALPATLTLAHACAALRTIEARLAAGGDLRLDASGVQDLDTSAVALVLQARRLAQARGVGFSLAAAPPKLQALAQLYGVSSPLASDSAGASSA